LKARRGKFGRRDGRETNPPKAHGTKSHGPARGSHAKRGSAGTGAPAHRAGGASGRTRPAAPPSGLKSGSVVEGTVSANRAGYGFLRVDGLKESVFLPPPEMRGVMHGDRLRVKLKRDASDRWSGAVERYSSAASAHTSARSRSRVAAPG
jgi:hypothetical protein